MKDNNYESNYIDIAKYFYKNIEYMNNLKLQKLMFFAYIEYFNKCKKELFKDDFEAWVYGPVLPYLYYNFYKLLLNIDYKSDINKNIKNVLDYIIKKYGKKNAFELVDLAHEHPAWLKARTNEKGQKLKPFELSNNRLNIKQFLNENTKK